MGAGPETGSQEALERLRELLLEDDRVRQQRLADELSQLEQRVDALPQALPEVIESAHQAGQRLSRSLLKPVGQALKTIARNQPELLVSVLFPVIGPIIRRAIADALASMIRNLNRTLELSLSWRSWRWRIEAWRTGVPFAQVVLQHTLTYRIEHLLWIESDSGLLLAHATNSDAAIADHDAIAGMLTAISDFVRDSVLARAGETLDRVEMGEFSVRLLRTPSAYLAAVVRGEPGEKVRDGLRVLSEQLHAALEPEPRSYSDAAETRLRDWLNQSGQAQASRDERKPGLPWLAWLALLLVFGLLGWLGVLRWQQAERLQQLRIQLEAEPGLQIRSLREDGIGYVVTGWRDPLARPDAQLEQAFGLPADSLRSQWSSRISLEPEILARRLRALLQAPDSVLITVAGNGLLVVGEWRQAPADLQSRLQIFRSLIDVDTSQLDHSGEVQVLDPVQLQRELALHMIQFAGAQPLPPAQTSVKAMAKLVLPAVARDRSLQFQVVGSTDGIGTPEKNAELRRLRARWLFDALREAGVPGSVLTLAEAESAVEDSRDPAARHARLQLISTP